MSPTLRLHDAIAAATPIQSVSVGKRDDKATWRVVFADGTQWVYGSDPSKDTATQQAVRTVIASFDYNSITIEVVKTEAQRRIIALTGKTTLQDCMIKQFNALMRAGQLTDKRVNVGALTAEEEAEAVRLRALADQIKAIRAASDAIEAMSPIPADYAADSRWPG